MKISASLPKSDVEFLDRYANKKGLSSRSAALHKAIRLLKASELGSAYEAAWLEWKAEEENLWGGLSIDGLD